MLFKEVTWWPHIWDNYINVLLPGLFKKGNLKFSLKLRMTLEETLNSLRMPPMSQTSQAEP